MPIKQIAGDRAVEVVGLIEKNTEDAIAVKDSAGQGGKLKALTKTIQYQTLNVPDSKFKAV